MQLQLLFVKRLSMLLLFVYPFISNAQIEERLIGSYSVVSGSPAETIAISSDKVEVILKSEVIEKFFFYDKKNESYILELVDVNVTSVDHSIKKDRRLFNVSLLEHSSELMKLNMTHPNGMKQELILRKLL